MDNGEAKELTCMTHGHALSEGIAGGKGVPGRWVHRGKYWDNSNRIINNTYFKKSKIKQPKQPLISIKGKFVLFQKVVYKQIYLV